MPAAGCFCRGDREAVQPECECGVSTATHSSIAERRAAFDATIIETRNHRLARAIGSTPSPIHQIAVNAFSAPIRNAEGQMVMALSVTSNADRLTPDWGGAVPRQLNLAAAEISAQISFAQPSSEAA
ncbi:hypothetical protein [Variovorax sp. GB1R11]|uniref:hypothetical protein n=1 Tax=Variovorax sp. GB1R11 TaxID=3443741 RepID=UPI003F496EFF